MFLGGILFVNFLQSSRAFVRLIWQHEGQACGRCKKFELTGWLNEMERRVPTGQGKLEKVREFEWAGKGPGKIFFWKSRGKVMAMKNWCDQMSDFQPKMHEIRFPLGLCFRPCWGSFQRSPRPSSCI